MARRRHVIGVLREPGFRRLLVVRLTGQLGDGLFQGALAGAVLFNPEQQARPGDIAAAFTVLLLPYSLIGPFAGVLLDRWWRQRVLTGVNALRALIAIVLAAEIAGGVAGVAFYATALVLISASRFVLSALSAALPHVVAPDNLVTANSLSTTSGTVLAAVGGALAVGVRQLSGGGNAGYAAGAAIAVLVFAGAAAAALGFPRAILGPSEAQRRSRETAAEVLRGLAGGAREVADCPPVRLALAAVGVHRLCYGVTLVCTVLLYRSYFHDDGVFRAGLPGLGQAVVAIAIGGGAAAVVTPAAFRRIGWVMWPGALLLLAAALQVVLWLPYRLSLILLGAMLLGFAAQGVKISVDTLVQQHIDDDYRGRVFALYDMLFNVALVTAAVLTATVLPADGRAPVAVLILAASYALTAIGYVVACRSYQRSSSATARS